MKATLTYTFLKLKIEEYEILKEEINKLKEDVKKLDEDNIS